MSWREIPQVEWPEFLPAFGQQHRDWIVTVEETSGADHPPRLKRRLQGIWMAPGRVDVELMSDGGPEHILLDLPDHVRVNHGSEGGDSAIAIESGKHLLQMRFRSAPPPEDVDGVMPDQLGAHSPKG